MARLCGAEGCFKPVFGGKMCKSHQHLRTDKKPKELVKTRLKRQSIKAKRQIPLKKEELLKQWEFFREIWAERPHISEVSGTPIYGEPLSTYFHHILPKSKFKEWKFVKKNIIILTFEEHQKVENDPYVFEEINDRRDEILWLIEK